MSDTETIYVDAEKGATGGYFELEARRTSENYFEIVSEANNEIVCAFRCGDIVRCAWHYFGDGFDGGVVAVYLSSQKLQDFNIGDRVRVSEHAGWSNNFYGKVTSDSVHSEDRLGSQTIYWIEFESPQKDRGR